MQPSRDWRSDDAPLLVKLPDNRLNIWHYGFTEMFNNVNILLVYH